MFLLYKKCSVALLLLLISLTATIGSDIIQMQDEDEKLILGSYVDILEDPLSQFTITQISSPAFAKQFQTNKKIYPYVINENLNSSYWLRIKIKNSSMPISSCIAQFNNPTLSFVEVFYKDVSGNFRTNKAGDLLPFNVREYKHPRITFEVPLNNDTTIVYFKIKCISHSGFSLSLYSLKSFYATTKAEYYMQGIYLGIILLMILYNLMTYFAVRENVYIYFCFYVLCCALFTLNATRIGFEYLWPTEALFNTHGSYVIASMLLSAFSLYTINIINLKKYYPKLIPVVFYLTLFIILYNGIVDYILIEEHFAHYLSFYFPFIVTYVIAFMVAKKGYKPALYFLIGLSFIIISMVFTTLERMDLFWPNAFTVYGLHIAFVIEMIVFSYALSERLRIIKEEKEHALYEKSSMQVNLIEQYKQNEILKDTVNKELEEKVSQRTIALNEKNKEMSALYDKIKLQAEELSKWNVRLDLDNQKLSHDIKEVNISRVLDKNVAFEDFNRIFPDNQSCYRFLEELKWGNGFTCIECKNEKYSEGKIIFSKRCTKCGYEESIIYNTLFQGSKIELSKQFYMLFLIYNSDGKIPYSHLSEILSMRLKTCWAFSKKIKDKMKNHKWTDLNGWDSMILLKD